MSAVDSVVGRVVAGRYQLVRLIGRGGMGAVYEAIQLELGRRVALKLLLECDDGAVARFRQEALLIAAITHPNLVQVTDLVTDDDLGVGIVMELLEGSSLAAIIARDGPFPPARAIALALQILAGLGAAHERGIVHRDIKPSNIQVVRSGHGPELAKVVDFGIAKSLDGGSYRTTTGVVLGTPAYMAPEQVLGQPLDTRTDLYAVGTCLFEMLTGARVTGRSTGPEVARAVLALDPARLVASIAPRALGDVVARALARDPAHRWPSANAMAAALDEAAASTPTDPPLSTEKASVMTSPPEPNRPDGRSLTKRGRLFATALALTAALGGVLLLVLGWAVRPRQAPTDAATTGLSPVAALAPPDGEAASPDAAVSVQPPLEAPPPIHQRTKGGGASPRTPAIVVDASAVPNAPYDRCWCEATLGGVLEVLSPKQRTCYCNPEKGAGQVYFRKSLCQVPTLVDGRTYRCDGSQIADPGDFHEARCSGWTLDEAGATPTRGLIQCYFDSNPHPGTHRAPCTGYANGKEQRGTTRCER